MGVTGLYLLRGLMRCADCGTVYTGPLAHARVVTEGVEDEVLLVSEQCKVYRTNLEGISTQGRHASGVIIWRPGGDDQVASIACFQNNHKAE